MKFESGDWKKFEKAIQDVSLEWDKNHSAETQSSGSVQHAVVNHPTVEAREHLPRTIDHAVAQYYVVVLEVAEEASAEW